ncbi:hypothetical protein CHU95_11535 [Niveispirillum lacus]|uniref:Response regulatory domain-containing protein n=1 Tax=Niveispirillum lacus TaxID=1981099 RepID=A0A255YXY5_9PROT|nr:response regulator [Niveispirillum lacus]OYQ34097.1 hypothetical protein CHU95_11535 [Niveispirillum lacus]
MSARSEAQGGRILLVEDSPTQAWRLRLLLGDEGDQVEQVESAEAALSVLNRWLPHLLIVDHHLPGMQGGALCRLIRLHLATLFIPILMLTVDETPAHQREGLDSGADDFLAKSTDPAVWIGPAWPHIFIHRPWLCLGLIFRAHHCLAVWACPGRAMLPQFRR